MDLFEKSKNQRDQARYITSFLAAISTSAKDKAEQAQLAIQSEAGYKFGTVNSLKSAYQDLNAAQELASIASRQMGMFRQDQWASIRDSQSKLNSGWKFYDNTLNAAAKELGVSSVELTDQIEIGMSVSTNTSKGATNFSLENVSDLAAIESSDLRDNDPFGGYVSNEEATMWQAESYRDADPFGGYISDAELASFYSDAPDTTSESLGTGAANGPGWGPAGRGDIDLSNDVSPGVPTESFFGISKEDPGALMGNSGNDMLTEATATVTGANFNPGAGFPASNQNNLSGNLSRDTFSGTNLRSSDTLGLAAPTGASGQSASGQSNSGLGNANYGVEPDDFVDAYTAAHDSFFGPEFTSETAPNSAGLAGEQSGNYIESEQTLSNTDTYSSSNVGGMGPGGSALSPGMFSNNDMENGAYNGGDYGYGYGLDSDGNWGSNFSDGTVDTVGGSIDAMANDAEMMGTTGNGSASASGGPAGFTETATMAPMSGMVNGVWGVESGGGDGAGGESVICTELRRQNLIPNEWYTADEKAGRYYAKQDPDVIHGYHAWGKTVARGMKKSKIVTFMACHLALPWAREMYAQQGNNEFSTIRGKILCTIGVPMCRLLGKYLRENKPDIARI